MDELIKLLQVVRKLEVLFLPLFPQRWRTSPLSFRMFSPIFQYLGHYPKKYPWAEALSMWLEANYLLSYHKSSLAVDDLSTSSLHYVRFLMLGIAAILAAALTPEAQDLSPWIHGFILLTVYGLAFYGSMQISISALWLAWGILFVPVGFYMMVGAARWAPVLLGLWGLLWHVGVLNESRKWQWYDMAATLPIFFFWLEPLSSSFLDTWAIWQRGLLCVSVWAAVWITLIKSDHSSSVSRMLQLFMPASQMALALLVWLKVSQWKGYLPPLGVWLACMLIALLLSLLLSLLSKRLASYRFLHRAKTMVFVLAAYGVVIALTGVRPKLEPVLSNSIHYLYNHSWPVWFFLGASTMMAIRGMAVTNLRCVQAFLPPWILPIVLWVFLGWAVWTDRFSTSAMTVTFPQAILGSLLFGAGTTWLVWNKKERLLQEWLFWGFFVYFLLQGYWKEAEGTARESSTATTWQTFILLSVWTLWLSYDTVCKQMKRLKDKLSEASALALMGALLLFMVAGLWLSYVDQRFSVGTEITYHLFLGFTFLGIPRILYQLAVQFRKTPDRPLHIPWGWMVLSGIVLVQVLQGAEHYAVGLRLYPHLDDLHRELMNALNQGGIENAAPAWVTVSSWFIPWRIVRWLAAMAFLTVFIVRRGKQSWSPFSLKITMVLLSFMVCFAEMRWIDWPGLPYPWAVVLRPWQASQVVWDTPFLSTYAIYAGMGLLWGWLLSLLWDVPSDGSLSFREQPSPLENR